jgi:hypothetical protein
MPPAVGQFSQDSGGRALFEVAFGLVHNGGGGRRDAADVLQKQSCRTASVGVVQDVEEEPGARTIEANPSAGDTEVLARESRNDEIHASTPASSVEGEKVGPDRRCIQGAFFHARDQDSGCVSFPLNVADGAMREAQELEPGSQSFSKHADPGTELDGMNSHTIRPPRQLQSPPPWRRRSAPTSRALWPASASSRPCRRRACAAWRSPAGPLPVRCRGSGS